MEQHPNNQMMIFHGNFANEIYNKVLEFSIEVGCNYFEFCLRHDIDFLGDGTYSYSKNVEYLMEELASFSCSRKPNKQLGYWTYYCSR